MMEMRELSMDEVMMVGGGKDGDGDNLLDEILIVANHLAERGGGSGSFWDSLFKPSVAAQAAATLERQGFDCTPGSQGDMAYVCRPEPPSQYRDVGQVICSDGDTRQFYSGDAKNGYANPPANICN